MDYQQESKKITDWIQDIFEKSGLDKIVIGLSGGIDSSLSATLASQAVGVDRIIPVLMPYGSLSAEAVKDAKLVVDFLKIPEEQVVTIDIQPGVHTIVASLKLHPDPLLKGEGINREEIIRLGNIMARVRMITLFDIAKKSNGLVCGTENKSEHYLGYYTRFGDEASDLEPIRSLYKTAVWEMAKTLGIPEKIITKAPTAGLWQEQTDENELGFSYKDGDAVLHYYIDEKLSEKEIIGKGLDRQIVSKVIERATSVSFKHILPYIYE